MEGIERWLFEEKEDAYQAFIKKHHPGIESILGVRLPKLRKKANEIVKKDWRTYLESGREQYMEDQMLKAFVLAKAVCPFTEKRKRITAFVPKIRSWSVCDSFCQALHFTKEEKEEVIKEFREFRYHANPYAERFFFVFLNAHYVDKENLSMIFTELEEKSSDAYYVMMAKAWLLSTCYIRFPKETMPFLEETSLDPAILFKGIQKMLDSRKVADKEILSSLRRRKRDELL